VIRPGLLFYVLKVKLMETMLIPGNRQNEKKGAANYSNSVPSFFKPVIQPKLSVNEPGDRYEQEADAMADRVMRMSMPSIGEFPFFKPAQTGIQRKCEHCEEEEKLHRKESSGAETHGGNELDSYVGSLGSSGQALPESSRQFFEPRFGQDFSNVRIHTDSVAAKSAQSINALAYTTGNNIVFNNGQYSPESDSGKRLMAHELTHVVQQASAESKLHRKEETAVECPATYTIPDDVHTGLEEAWKKSGHGGDTVAEQGGRIVTDKDGKRVIRTGGGGSGSISLPAEQAGDTTTGTFHTHPYSKSEGSTIGVSFSGGDISNFVSGGQGTVKYIGAGTCNFVLNTVSTAARDTCKTVDLPKRWNDAFAKASGTFQEKVETAVKTTIVNCGMCYYKACRPDDKSPIPKDAKLA
jgi:hypothetical protein